jgi:hypothetical protein
MGNVYTIHAKQSYRSSPKGELQTNGRGGENVGCWTLHRSKTSDISLVHDSGETILSNHFTFSIQYK